MLKRKLRRWCEGLAVLAVIGSLLSPGSVSADTREKAKIIFVSNAEFQMDFPIAIEEHYFDKLGLDVEAIDVLDGPTRYSLTPRADINGVFLSSDSALTMIDKGLDLVMVCGIGNETFDFAVLATSPIKSIKDFEGKTIANTSPPSCPRLGLDYDTAEQHIKATTISTQTPPDRISMLVSGRVDVILSSPATAAVLGNRIRVVHTVTTSKYLWNSCGWWFKPDFIKTHPDAVRRFVQGLAQARKLINENPNEAIRVYAKYNKLKNDAFKSPFKLPQFDNPPVIYTYGLEQTYRIMKKFGALKRDIDTSKLVDGRFAKSLTAPY